jgi:hypothetical protein
MTLASAWAGQEIKEGPGEIVIPDEIVIRLKPGATLAGVLGSLNITATSVASSTTMPIQVIRVPAALRQTVSTILANHPEIEYVEPHRIRTSTGLTPNDASFASQWWLGKTQAAAAWSLLPGRLTDFVPMANRVRVAILDTGADCTHPDFVDVVGGTTATSGGSQFAAALSTAIVPTTITSPACLWQDDHGHGTHVAGILAAATNNGKGIASLGFPAQLMIYKVMDKTGYGSDFDIASGITRAADAGARIISMSLGGAGYSQLLQDAVDYAWSKNVLVIAAAGNSNSSTLFYPAGANYVLGVGATDSSDAKASFSNFGFGLDVMAPGVNILSTYPGNTYVNMSGTSMATPMVSAVAGLIAATTTDLASDAVAQRIEQSAESKSTTGAWDQYYGYGRVNALHSLSGEMRATTTGGLAGQVINASGTPVNGAQVRMGGVLITTPATGLFRFGNMPVGATTLTVSDGVNPTWSYNVVIPAGADSSLRVRLGVPTGAFTGSVTAGGQLLAGAVVQASQAGVVKASAVTDNNGLFTLPVTAGTYDLLSSAVGHSAYRLSAQTVAAGGSRYVQMLMHDLGTITGTVVNDSGTPLAGVQITVDSGSFSAGAVTDAQGKFTTLGLPAGTYSTTASLAGGISSTTAGVGVIDGSSTVANFQLANAGVLYQLTLSAASFGSGTTIAGNKVILTGPAGASGAVVTLRSSNSAVALPPASVTIPAGASQSAPFSITTGAVTVDTAVTISASLAGMVKTANLTVAPFTISSIVLSTTQLAGGGSSTSNQIYISANAPVGGAIIRLTSSNPAVTVPASVTIPEGSRVSAPFTILTTTVSAATSVTLTATYFGSVKTAIFTVTPTVLTALSTWTTAVTGGNPIKSVSVTLNGPAPVGGAVVLLTSSDSAAVPPVSVTVPAGSTTSGYFTIPTLQVNTSEPVTIKATYGGVSKSVTVNVKPTALSALYLSATPISGGKNLGGSIYIDGPAPSGGAVVTLSSANPVIATPPATVTVAAGAAVSPTFIVKTGSVTAATPVVITATYGGVSKSITVNVKPTALAALVASVAAVTGGKASGASVALDGPAPPAGAVVTLISSSPTVVIPPSTITIAGGATYSTYFAIATRAVMTTTQVTITASYGGVSKSAIVTVNP